MRDLPDAWETAIAFVLRMEGGTTVENDPHDPGGMTKFGISHKAFPDLDIANLTLEQAKEIYRREYWQKCRCDDLPRGLAIAVFDTAVNQGRDKAKKLLQLSLGVDVDGIIGERTMLAAASASSSVATRFLANRLAEYARLMAGRPDLLRYAVNWSYRVLRLADLISGDRRAA